MKTLNLSQHEIEILLIAMETENKRMLDLLNDYKDSERMTVGLLDAIKLRNELALKIARL